MDTVRLQKPTGPSGDVPGAELSLPIGRYRLSFERDGQWTRSGFLGSAWRGAFGHALRRTVCVTRLASCSECLLYRSCAYPYIFETPPPADTRKMRRYPAVPHPFSLDLPFPGDASETHCSRTEVCINLFGHANRFLPYVIFALQKAGDEGVGPGRLKLALCEVDQAASEYDAWHTIYRPDGQLKTTPVQEWSAPPAPGEVYVTLETPLRLRHNERLVRPGDLSFPLLFSALLRRISMLTYFHTDHPLDVNFKALIEAAQGMEIREASLSWHDWTRYSSRQKATMQMGGIVGRFRLSGEELEQVWPYLWLGQWTHAGRACSMGLGRYRITTVASLPETKVGYL